MVAHIYNSGPGRLRQEDCEFEASLGLHTLTPYPSQNIKTGGVAQAVECLLCKHKVLSPQSNQKRKNKLKKLKTKYLSIQRNV
jgi:hypothetical protein